MEKIIKSLKNSSAGWNAICPKVVKATYNSFLAPLTHIMNMSLVSGVFPTELKIARVIPIFKSGDAGNFTNYRPVSVLPLFFSPFRSICGKNDQDLDASWMLFCC